MIKRYLSQLQKKISPELVTEETLLADITVLLDVELKELWVAVYQRDGDTQRFIGRTVQSLPTTPLTMTVVLNDGTKRVRWNLGRES